jgi:hypothetical protein
MLENGFNKSQGSGWLLDDCKDDFLISPIKAQAC